MNQKTNYHSTKFILFLSILIQIIPVVASQYGPSLLFHKPYSTKPYLGSFYMSFSQGTTNQGYNKHSKTVPFLQEYGSEDLLRNFIDPTIPKNNIETLGKINFLGTLNFERLNLSYYKNIHHDLFIGISTVVQNLNVNSIDMDINLTSTLTTQELHQLEIFKSKIPTSMSTSGMLTTTLDLGYNKIFNNFKNIKFLQLYLKGAIATPQWITGQNLSILQYPLAGNISFAYPITAITSVGVSEYMNFGISGTIIPFQPTQLQAPVNRTDSHNQILLRETTRVQVNPKPVYSAVFYLEAHSFIPNLMATIGYGASCGTKWTISSFNQSEFANEKINRNEILNGWTISALFFQLDYNFSSTKHPQAPALSLFYVIPLAGSYFPKMNVMGGGYNLAFSYHF